MNRVDRKRLAGIEDRYRERLETVHGQASAKECADVLALVQASREGGFWQRSTSWLVPLILSTGLGVVTLRLNEQNDEAQKALQAGQQAFQNQQGLNAQNLLRQQAKLEEDKYLHSKRLEAAKFIDDHAADFFGPDDERFNRALTQFSLVVDSGVAQEYATRLGFAVRSAARLSQVQTFAQATVGQAPATNATTSTAPPEKAVAVNVAPTHTTGVVYCQAPESLAKNDRQKISDALREAGFTQPGWESVPDRKLPPRAEVRYYRRHDEALAQSVADVAGKATGLAVATKLLKWQNTPAQVVELWLPK